MTQPVYYATLRDAREAVKAASVSDDTVLLHNVAVISARIDMYFGFGFWPLIATHRYPYNSRALADLNLLSLHYPLLAGTTLTNASGGVITPYTLHPRNSTPYGAILSPTAFGYTTLDSEEITLLGTWGYRKEYANAWFLSGDSVQNVTQISATDVSLTVTSAAGVDAYGRSPRFSAGQLLRIETEYLIVTSVAANVLTVIRGARGSTAAIHLAATVIYIFEVEPVIQRAVNVWAGLIYARRGDFQQAQLDVDGKILSFPKDAPTEVDAILCELDNETWRRLP